MKGKNEEVQDIIWEGRLKKEGRGIGKANLSLLQELHKIDFKSLLDVGCGDGLLLEHLRKIYPKKTFVGADISETALKAARGKKLTVKKIDGEKLPFKDNSFDAVVSVQVLQHVENPDKFIKELQRVSKKFVLINAPNHSWWRFRVKKMIGLKPDIMVGETRHTSFFDFMKLKELLEKNRLEIISFDATGSVPLFGREDVSSFYPELFGTGFTFLCRKL